MMVCICGFWLLFALFVCLLVLCFVCNSRLLFVFGFIWLFGDLVLIWFIFASVSL